MKLANQLHFERGFLPGFPNRGRLKRFSVVDESARKRPAVGRVFPLNHHDARIARLAFELDDDVHRKIGISGGIHMYARNFAQGNQ